MKLMLVALLLVGCGAVGGVYDRDERESEEMTGIGIGLSVGVGGLGAGKGLGQLTLESALAWGSTADQTVVSSDLTGTVALATNATATVGAADPWGGTTAFTIADTVTASASHWVRWQMPSDQVIGEQWLCEFYYKKDPAVSQGNEWAFTLNLTGATLKWNWPNKNISKITGTGDPARAEILALDDGWVRIRIYYVISRVRGELQMTANGGSNYVGTGATLGYMTPPHFKRVAVSAQTNLASGSAATISQGTAANRPNAPAEWRPDGTAALWADGHTGGYLSSAAVGAALAGTAQPWAMSFLVEFREVWRVQSTPTTGGWFARLTSAGSAALTISQTTTGLSVRRINDAATDNTATLPIAWVKDLPQVITITYDGAEVQLYVNGVALGAAQALNGGAATFAGFDVGGDSHVAIAEWVAWDYVPTVAEIRASATSLAARRSTTTASLPVWLGGGQSNGDVTAPNLLDIDQDDRFPDEHNVVLFRHKADGDSNTSRNGWGKVRVRLNENVSTVEYSPTRGAFGWEWGFALHSGRCAIVNFTKGGNKIENFLASGTLWSAQIAEYQDALDDLDAGGIPWHIAGLVTVWGESDSVLLARANSFGDHLEELRSDLETEFGITIPVVISQRVHVDLEPTAHPYSTELRANVAAWELADPDTRVCTNADDLALKVDDVHWSSAMTYEIGQRFARQDNRVKDL